MAAPKPHRIRVRVLDGKRRDRNKLKGQLVPHVDVIDAQNGVEFVVCAVREGHLDQVRAKLAAAGLEEIPGGDTDVSPPGPKPADIQGGQRRGQGQRPRASRGPAQPNTSKLKPYGFVPIPEKLMAEPPVWHDGTDTKDRLAGEIRCEIETLTPLLVGWERRQIDDADEPCPVPYTPVSSDEVEVHFDGVGRTTKKKSVLCPLRAPWGDRPVLLPGDSLKGLLRHELGALLGAPMERVAERSYSYRPNLRYPDNDAARVLEPRLARVRSTEAISVDGKVWPFPERVDVLRIATRDDQIYYPRRGQDGRPPEGFEPYRGGLGGGRKLPEALLSAEARRKTIHTHIGVARVRVEHEGMLISDEVKRHYGRTLSHLLDSDDGHFSARHPNVGTNQTAQCAATDAICNAARSGFQPGDLIWVEWDVQKRCIVSLGWHYYYRWAYADTVHKKGWQNERYGLFPLEKEKTLDKEHAPQGLSAVRRLFGYTGDNEGSKGIGQGDHSQLMGRISVNAAIEVVEPGDTAEKRFLPPTFLKELGMPRPSAVEHYLEQPYHPSPRPWDRASLVTYGDAAGYDEPGRLAGRKFYLDRKDAYAREPWKDDNETNRLNERSTLALEASCSDRRFRFTVRFRDLDPAELAAVLAALCPHQFRTILGGNHPDGYCSKLGYARPLGWGSVRIETKETLLLDTSAGKPALTPVADLTGWMRQHFVKTPMPEKWLSVHRCKHPDAADYPTEEDKEGNKNIYTYHTNLRAKHSRDRRYDRERR